jgi:hypothetical protein
MEYIVLSIGIVIVVFSVLLFVASMMFNGEDKAVAIIAFLLGVGLIYGSFHITNDNIDDTVIKTHYRIEPTIKVVEYKQPYTNKRYKDTIYTYARKYPIRNY